MVVEDDLGVGNISRLIDKTILGRFCGKLFSPPSLKDWLESNWKLVLGYIPTFCILSRGWLCFEFLSQEDLLVIFSHSWGWGPSSLVLKEWTISFNPAQDFFPLQNFGPFYQNLPLFFFREDIMQVIGNSISVFVGLK